MLRIGGHASLILFVALVDLPVELLLSPAERGSAAKPPKGVSVEDFELRKSLDLLVAVSDELTEVARVDFVVADPEPRFVLREVGDPELLQRTLGSQG